MMFKDIISILVLLYDKFILRDADLDKNNTKNCSSSYSYLKSYDIRIL